jgi:hypothetical protein
MNTWEEIRSWYFRNGYTMAAMNMREIQRAWEGNERDLLAMLRRYRP